MKVSDKFKVNEDSAVPAIDQIYNRVNFESNIDWARRNEMPKVEFNQYLEQIGRRYLSTKLS